MSIRTTFIVSLVASMIGASAGVVINSNRKAVQRLESQIPQAETLLKQGLNASTVQGVGLAQGTIRQAENYKKADFPLGINPKRLDAVISDCKTLLSNHYAGTYADYNLGTNSGNTVNRAGN